MSEDLTKYLPGFDYANLSDEQKEAVTEVFRILSERHSTLDLTPLRIKFNLEEKKYYNLEDSYFYKECEKAGIVVNTQGYVKQGMGEDAIHYPLVDLAGDIRVFDKMFNNYKEEVAKLLGVSIHNEDK